MIYVSHLLDDREMKNVLQDEALGIESIEFSIADNLDHLNEKLAEYKKRLTELECQKLTLHGPFLDLNPAAFDSLVQQATRKRYEQCYQAARELGAKKIIFHSGFVPSVYFLEGWAERAADFYNRFLEDKSGEIEILMENVLDPFPGPLRDVAEQISHPAFGICLDVGHAHCYSEAACDEWIEVLNPYIRHVHVHDNCGDHDSHMALGQGTLKREKLLDLLGGGVDATIECRSICDVETTYRQICRKEKI